MKQKTHTLEAAREKRREMSTTAWRRRCGRPGKSSVRRGEPLSRYSDDDVLAVNRALTELESIDPRTAELVELRFFGNLSLAEAAGVLGGSLDEVTEEWTVARAWLRRAIGVELAEQN